MEQEPFLKSLNIDFQENAVSMSTTTGETLRFRLAPLEEPVTQEEAAQTEEKVKKTLTLSGKVKGAVRAGRPDSQGNPTAWARVAAHKDDVAEAWMLSTTFHRASVGVALGLKPEDPITFEGYLRPTTDPARMDSFSVFHVINYPGKPDRPTRM